MRFGKTGALLGSVQLLLLGLLSGGCRTAADIAADDARSDGGGLGEPVDNCREQLSPLDPAGEQRLGFRAATLLPKVIGAHETALTWIDVGADSTRLIVGISEARAYFVRSRTDSGSLLAGPMCAHHMALDVHVTLQTRDALLDEDVEHVRMVAYGDDEAHGWFRIEAGALRGDYAPVVGPRKCFRQLEVRLLVGNDGTHGTLADVIADGPCDAPSNAPLEYEATARWGTRWLHY